MKLKLYFCLLILICMISSGCRKEELINMEVSDETKNVNELINTIYTNEELEQINNLNLNYDDLNKEYKVECLRRTATKDYKAIYRSKDKYLTIIFDKKGNKKLSDLDECSPDKELFNSLKVGSHMSEVKKIDNTKQYNTGYLSSSTAGVGLTHHYTNDGYIITIFYDYKCEISEIIYDLL